jgi:hypothetical protein
MPAGERVDGVADVALLHPRVVCPFLHADDSERAKIRAFVMGMAAAMATDLVARPVLAGIAAGFSTADLGRDVPTSRSTPADRPAT